MNTRPRHAVASGHGQLDQNSALDKTISLPSGFTRGIGDKRAKTATLVRPRVTFVPIGGVNKNKRTSQDELEDSRGPTDMNPLWSKGQAALRFSTSRSTQACPFAVFQSRSSDDEPGPAA